MVELVKPAAEWCAAALETVGLGTIALLSGYALVYAVVRLVKAGSGGDIFRETRHRPARGILVGLDFLVGADIVHTVDLTFTLGGRPRYPALPELQPGGGAHRPLDLAICC